MKISAFHLMPHRELPQDFERKYESVWVTPPWHELAEPKRVGQYYNWTLDELLFAARAGFDGVCTNEHHQNAYGFMPSPNIMGAVMASMRSVSTRMVVFDTSVVDLSAHLADPVDLLFGTQLGGGTDIAQAIRYCQTLVTRPRDTMIARAQAASTSLRLWVERRTVRSFPICLR